jgi:flagellar motility protein MotE (MotC chaperone)
VTGTQAPPDRIPGTFGSLPTTPWFNPILAGGDDMLTTQVTGDEDPAREMRSEQVPSTRGDQYCSNIASAAADARFAWQRQTLLDTEEQVKKRIEALQAQIAEYQKWLARRDEFSKKAQAAVTDIYSKMRPDAAAQQLMVLDEETAAAVISQLNPRNASAVMAEMTPNEAARITAIISASSKGPKGKPPVQPQGGGT